MKISSVPLCPPPSKSITGLIKVVNSYFIKSLERDRGPKSFASPKKHLFPAWILVSIYFAVSLFSVRIIPWYLNWSTLPKSYWPIFKIRLNLTLFCILTYWRVNLFLLKISPADWIVTLVHFVTLIAVQGHLRMPIAL